MAKRKIIIPLTGNQPTTVTARSTSAPVQNPDWQTWLDKISLWLEMAEELLEVAEPVLSAWVEIEQKKRGGKKR